MLQRLRSRLHGEGGFTLIELLVVILIIGILAAIAIPSFLNQKGKGVDASAKSDVRTATAMETYYTDSGSYASADAAALKAIESSLNDAKNLTVTVSGGGTGYTVTANGGDTRTFSITKAADGSTTRPCALNGATNKGGCANGTSW